MKRFLLLCLLLLLLCAAVLFPLSRLYLQFVGTNYLRFCNDTLKFESVPNNITFAAFGSSHCGASIRVEAFSDQTMFNFYLSAQSPIMDAELYKLYRDHIANNAVVTLTISPMSFYTDPTGDMTHMKRYCDALPVRALPTLGTKLYRLFRVVDFHANDIFEYFRTRNVSDYGAALSADTQAGLAANSDKSQLDWASWGSALAAIQTNEFTCDPTNGPDKRVLRELDTMLSDCVSRGYRVALYTPPFTNYYWGHFSEEFQLQMRKDAASLAATYGIPYFDYSEDTRFCTNMGYFEDVDHMSIAGSKAFVPVLLEDINHFYN
jgi:hypothetical protein